LLLLLVLAPACLACLGCSDPGDNDEACWEEDSPSGKAHSSAAKHRAQITVVHDLSYSGGSSTTKRSITAAFKDITYAEMASTTPGSLECDVACVVRTGAPYKVCKKDPCELRTLEANTVVVDVGSGAVTLEQKASGSFNSYDSPEPLFGPNPVKATVTSGTAASDFPSFDISLAPPDLIELERPDPSSSTPVGTSDLKVRWKPGNGDFLVAEIRSADPSITDKVQCFLQDDGCHHIGACALDKMDVKAGDSFRFSLERVRIEVKAVDANTSALLSLSSQVSATLTR